MVLDFNVNLTSIATIFACIGGMAKWLLSKLDTKVNKDDYMRLVTKIETCEGECLKLHDLGAIESKIDDVGKRLDIIYAEIVKKALERESKS